MEGRKGSRYGRGVGNGKGGRGQDMGEALTIKGRGGRA